MRFHVVISSYSSYSPSLAGAVMPCECHSQKKRPQRRGPALSVRFRTSGPLCPRERFLHFILPQQEAAVKREAIYIAMLHFVRYTEARAKSPSRTGGSIMKKFLSTLAVLLTVCLLLCSCGKKTKCSRFRWQERDRSRGRLPGQQPVGTRRSGQAGRAQREDGVCGL